MSNQGIEHNRAARIELLKKQIEQATGNKVVAVGMEEGYDPELVEQFLEHVLYFEQTPDVQLFEQLTEGGLEIPHPDNLNDAQLNKKLWEVIRALAMHSCYLDRTDHLNDRQLYDYLWHDLLREEGIKPCVNVQVNCHIDILGRCSDEDLQTVLKYYADDGERDFWATELPDINIPDKASLPYDRDRHLPQPYRDKDEYFDWMK